MQHYKNLQEFIVDDLPYVSLFFKNRGFISRYKGFRTIRTKFFSSFIKVLKSALYQKNYNNDHLKKW